MGYKSLLVSLNEIGRLKQVIAAAVTLGKALGVHVSGLYVIPAVQVYPSVGFEAAPQVFEGNRTYFKDHAESVRKTFEETMTREGLLFDLRVIDARSPLIADDVIAHGRSADIILASATDPSEVTGVERDFIEQVIISSGRPVIVLPAVGDSQFSLEEIILGWDGGREAARATFDALPLLKCAAKVRVVRVDPQKDANLRGSMPGADIADTLARHDVKVEVQSYPTNGLDAGQALLRCADDSGATLIVMGAYGHSRITEFLFGGATRVVLTRLNRPVLLSH